MAGKYAEGWEWAGAIGDAFVEAKNPLAYRRQKMLEEEHGLRMDELRRLKAQQANYDAGMAALTGAINAGDNPMMATMGLRTGGVDQDVPLPPKLSEADISQRVAGLELARGNATGWLAARNQARELRQRAEADQLGKDILALRAGDLSRWSKIISGPNQDPSTAGTLGMMPDGKGYIWTRPDGSVVEMDAATMHDYLGQAVHFGKGNLTEGLKILADQYERAENTRRWEAMRALQERTVSNAETHTANQYELGKGELQVRGRAVDVQASAVQNQNEYRNAMMAPLSAKAQAEIDALETKMNALPVGDVAGRQAIRDSVNMIVMREQRGGRGMSIPFFPQVQGKETMPLDKFIEHFGQQPSSFRDKGGNQIPINKLTPAQVIRERAAMFGEGVGLGAPDMPDKNPGAGTGERGGKDNTKYKATEAERPAGSGFRPGLARQQEVLGAMGGGLGAVGSMFDMPEPLPKRTRQKE